MLSRCRFRGQTLARFISYKDFYIETYGCQMNFADTELISTILTRSGYSFANSPKEAVTLLCNTCSIRQHAENRVFSRIEELRNTTHKQGLIGVVGCMAKKLTREKCVQHGIDFVVSPDCYRELPQVIKSAYEISSPQIYSKSISTECYDEIYPDCRDTASPNSRISIARGCNNMCSYCIVPFAKGRERSRSATTIVEQFSRLTQQRTTKQVTLLGQNVNSYCDNSDLNKPVKFPELLETLARCNPEVRIRFMSPHPKDFPVELLEVIARHSNICNTIHLPMQSGSNSVLKRMRRHYTVESYMELVNRIRSIIPGVGLTTDLIAGFCDETEQEVEETLQVLKAIQFDSVPSLHI
eukprot:TRINITY_DN958_c0_g5_i1.p1 TRINITY_DN958_c0_g5~~TRINITY_DN958_c0_g5_i1.p1  ORF type:complete len:354 (-),score=64.38 TRINITY_DN958_c0_g5_i1:520-1581(-)